MESIIKRLWVAALSAFAVMAVAVAIAAPIIAPQASYAEVSEGDIKLTSDDYKIVSAAACSDSIDLAPATLYYIDADQAKKKYDMEGLPYADSYATGINSPEKDKMLVEVMDELCGNPSALYATINGLQYVMDKSFGVNFLKENPWAKEYVDAANKQGLNQFVTRKSASAEWKTSKEHRQVAAGVNTLLLRWDNAGVVTQQTTIANWADLNRGQIFGALPKPEQRKDQENLPALKLTLADKDRGSCVTAIGFNTSDKRFEMLDCSTPKAAAAKPKPTEVNVVPDNPKEKPAPKQTPKEKPKEKPTTPKEKPKTTTPKEKPTTPKEKPKTTTPKEKPTKQPEKPKHKPTPTPMPTPDKTPPPKTTPPETTPPETTPPETTPPETTPPETTPPEKTLKPKSPDKEDYKRPGDGDERDSGEGEKSKVPKVTEPASDPKPVETEKPHESGVTDSPTKKPGSETGVKAPGAETPGKDKGDGGKDKGSDEPATQPTKDPDPVVVDDGPANDEEVDNPF